MTTPDVFIIESLKFKDEKNGWGEGKFLAHILKLAGRKYRYIYIRTRAELDEVIDQFDDSNFRYLHISCHANKKGIGLTLDDVSIADLAEMLAPVLEKRRVFLSACELATPDLATALMKGTGCYSVIGPSTKIDVDAAALFWASVYYLMFQDEARTMKKNDLRVSVQGAAQLFKVSMRYFTADTTAADGWTELNVKGPR